MSCIWEMFLDMFKDVCVSVGARLFPNAVELSPHKKIAHLKGCALDIVPGRKWAPGSGAETGEDVRFLLLRTPCIVVFGHFRIFFCWQESLG